MFRPEMTYEPEDCPVELGVNEDCGYRCPVCPLREPDRFAGLRRVFTAVGRVSLGIARRFGGES